MAFVQIDTAVINLQHVLMVVREPEKTLVYFVRDKTIVPRVYRGARATAVWEYFSARAEHLQVQEEPEVQGVDTANNRRFCEGEEIEV